MYMQTSDATLASLNDEQRHAAEQVRGPVQILAGAGTGKTTTVTHRIAWQVQSGAWDAKQLLAVTFTKKAANELVERLRKLGVHGVEARTFHGAAFWMLRFLWPHYMGQRLAELVGSKPRMLNPIVQRLPGAYRFRARRDVASDIEWAKNLRIPASRYAEELERSGRMATLPADLGQQVFEAYEARCRQLGQWDFEDMLGRLLDLFAEHPEAVERIRARFGSFTVDEYQDVSPLQQALLEQWVGDRDDLCVVGDDLQTVFSFTGATPDYLIDFPKRYPHAREVVLQTNYRSTPQVLAAANRLAGRFEGRARSLHPLEGRQEGGEPVLRACASDADEARWVAGEAKRLHAEHGTAWSEIAVLYRLNALSEPFEEVFSEQEVPYRVVGGTFLERPAARQLIPALRHAARNGADAVTSVQAGCVELGMDAQDDADEEETTRRGDLRRFAALAKRYADEAAGTPGAGDSTVGGFLADLELRFRDGNQDPSGVQLMTLHRSKGLEFDAVFLARCTSKLLPYQRKGQASDELEERRLLYVGITRARQHLYAAWDGAVSPFVEEAFDYVAPASSKATAGSAKSRGKAAEHLAEDARARFERLRDWRAREAKEQGKPAYVVFDDKTLVAIAEASPGNHAQLHGVTGVGPAKLERYADAVLDVLAGV